MSALWKIFLTFPEQGMSFRIYRLARKGGGRRVRARGFAQTIILAERAREPLRLKPCRFNSLRYGLKAVHRRFGSSNQLQGTPLGGIWDRVFKNSEGAQEFEERVLFAGFEFSKFLGNVFGLAAMTKNGVEQCDGGAVVHET